MLLILYSFECLLHYNQILFAIPLDILGRNIVTLVIEKPLDHQVINPNFRGSCCKGSPEIMAPEVMLYHLG